VDVEVLLGRRFVTVQQKKFVESPHRGAGGSWGRRIEG